MTNDLLTVALLEGHFRDNDLLERRPKDLDDLGSAADVCLNPPAVADSEFLPATVDDEVKQVWIVAAGQMGAGAWCWAAGRAVQCPRAEFGDGSALVVTHPRPVGLAALVYSCPWQTMNVGGQNSPAGPLGILSR